MLTHAHDGLIAIVSVSSRAWATSAMSACNATEMLCWIFITFQNAVCGQDLKIILMCANTQVSELSSDLVKGNLAWYEEIHDESF